MALYLSAQKRSVISDDDSQGRIDLEEAQPRDLMEIFTDQQRRPVAWLRHGRCGHRVMIVSIPKAGTYLYAYLLQHLGLEHIYLHLSEDHLSDYRFATRDEMRLEPEEFRRDFPLAQSLSLVREGQLVVGHLAHSAPTAALLNGWKVLFLYRDLRDAAISHMRFFAETGRGGPETAVWGQRPDGPEKLDRFLELHGSSLIPSCCDMIAWMLEPQVLSVSYESLMGDLGADAQAATISDITSWLDLTPPLKSPAELLKSVVGVNTKTWSGRRTVRERYWNGDVERRFDGLGGNQANRLLAERAELKDPHSRWPALLASVAVPAAGASD
ncbi:MAG TPA: sulfotransferase domain-containing protein [Pirellulales bacterium]|jgi:hypothetical protein|nr:sulfotransferase domain-containing protein [Pirellulales bacterium]